VLLTEVALPDPVMKKWLRYVKIEDDTVKVYAQPMVTRRIDEKEKARREAEKNAVRELKAKQRAEKKAKKEAERVAKKDAYTKRLAESQERKEIKLAEQKERLEKRLAELNAK